jgi:hypothetical protein
MRDRQHLSVSAQLFHEPAHRFCNGPAHAGIDLVKNQGARFAKLAGGYGNGQCNPRELAP